jgi:hypothetical protein
VELGHKDVGEAAMSMTPGAFAAHLGLMIAAEKAAHHKALEASALIMEEKAKGFIGNYEAGWPHLAASTIEHKANGDTPLLESGQLRDSIEHTVSGDHAYVGSNDQKSIWQFQGTSRIPARDPLAPASMQSASEVTNKVGEIIYSAITSV